MSSLLSKILTLVAIVIACFCFLALLSYRVRKNAAAICENPGRAVGTVTYLSRHKGASVGAEFWCNGVMFTIREGVPYVYEYTLQMGDTIGIMYEIGNPENCQFSFTMRNGLFNPMKWRNERPCK
jgi:hypothetical protein